MSRLKTDAIRNVNASVDGINLDTSGRIGIGTSSPTQKLEVLGTTNLFGNGGASVQWGDTSYVGHLSFNSSGAIVRAASSKALVFHTNHVNERMRIHSSGDVSIGRDSVLGSAKLSIQCDAGEPGISVQLNASAGTSDLIKAYSSAGPNVASICVNPDASPDLLFKLHDGSNTVERVRIRHTGEVGINCTPARPLHIVGNDGSSGATSGNSDTTVILENAGTNGSMIEFLNANNGAGHLMFTDPDGTNRGRISYHHNGDFFRVDTSGSEKLRITSDGKVGIGTTSPGHKLSILGGSSSQLEIKGTEADFWLTSTGSGSDKAWRILGSTGGSTHRFRIYDNANGKEPFYIIGSNGSNTQHVHINSGNLVFDAGGTGIDFSATSNASGMTSELLDSYEEGTWTINPHDGSCTTTWGKYRKIGNQVTVWARASGFSDTSTNDMIRIKGLPFSTSGSWAGAGGSAMIQYVDQVVPWVAFPEDDMIKFYGSATGGFEQLRHNELNSGHEIYFCVTYPVN